VKSTLIKVENQTLVKKVFKLKKMLQPKEQNTEGTKGKMKGTLEEGMNFLMECLVLNLYMKMECS
jgi:DUF438 domain-containing protein